MALGILAMHILEVMFFTGMAGSAVVVSIAIVRVLYHAVFDTDPAA